MSTIFQKIIDKEIPAKIIYEDDDTLAFLDLAQNTKGHTLVIPKKATRNVLSADSKTIANVNIVAAKLAKEIIETFDAKGANILSNAEEVAGQSVFHYHVHIIPRYTEDELIFKTSETNFDLDKIHQALTNK
ncbi:MAG TPA: HIT family protein [Erysipelothrix sp.]|nr:HIT family protein [Erysipelothrix sp.]